MLISLLSYLGLVAGIIIAHYTKEELKTGRKYFSLICQAILYALIILSFFYLVKIVTLVSLLLFLTGLLLTHWIVKDIYAGLGSQLVILYHFSLSTIFVPLAFLFGISYASMKKISFKKIVKTLIFFTAPLGIYLLFPYDNLLFLYYGIAVGDLKKWHTR